LPQVHLQCYEGGWATVQVAQVYQLRIDSVVVTYALRSP
jgi:hypothetical protein